MKPSSRYLTLLALAVFAGSAFAQETPSAPAPPAPDPKAMAEMMKKMQEAGTPGEAHQKIADLAGSWNVEVKSWMTPGAPPTVTKGTAKVTWILGNRFLQEEFVGEFMGKPFHGLSLTGYDNTKKVYSNVWMDDLHTSIYYGEGTLSEDGKAITFEGTFDCPLTGEKDLKMKQILHLESPDKHVLEMFDPRAGDKKSMEITYTRQ